MGRPKQWDRVSHDRGWAGISLQSETTNMEPFDPVKLERILGAWRSAVDDRGEPSAVRSTSDVMSVYASRLVCCIELQSLAVLFRCRPRLSASAQIDEIVSKSSISKAPSNDHASCRPWNRADFYARVECVFTVAHFFPS